MNSGRHGAPTTPIPDADDTVITQPPTHLAVWGDPIEHSRSPQLHAAAYRVLGVDWQYGRQQVSAEGFSEALQACDGSWRGLSLTMPLKEVAYRAAHWLDEHSRLTGATNTLLLSADGKHRGFNTDIAGLVAALREGSVASVSSVRVLGVGATAASAVVAARELGADRVFFVARQPHKATAVIDVADRLGVRSSVTTFDDDCGAVDLTISTIPSASVLAHDTAQRLADAGGVLFDVAYSPWPSALAQQWNAQHPVLSGLGMLLHQAVRQVRIFYHGEPDVPVPTEDDVVAAMRCALMGD
ncbi:shikimate dehydrogenase family protein [Microbacterium sp. YY-01]|uniref:shikimate dehydrogenase family protein n=1 Tax=Microbacterium sp. YY-01 TaxID=3421634 RepID=UPI003D171E95